MKTQWYHRMTQLGLTVTQEKDAPMRLSFSILIPKSDFSVLFPCLKPVSHTENLTVQSATCCDFNVAETVNFMTLTMKQCIKWFGRVWPISSPHIKVTISPETNPVNRIGAS